MADAPLADWIAEAAAAAVRIQERLNAGFDQERQQFQALVAACPPAVLPLLAPLAPAPRLARHTELTWSAHVGKSRTAGVSVTVRPINLGFQMTRKVTSESATRIRVSVEQVPFPAYKETAHGREQAD